MKPKGICVLFFLMTVYVANVRAWDFPLDISPIKIQFNHGYSDSALNIRVNASTDITVPEYDSGYSRNDKFAYVKGSTPDVLVMFYASPPDSPSLTIDAIGINGSSWDLNDKTVLFNGSGFSVTESGYPTNYVKMSSSTSVPNSIGIHSHTWSWRVVAVGGTPISPFYMGSISHDYYTVLDTPRTPMTEPWTDVLNYACDWANDKTTVSDAIDEIASELYYMGSHKILDVRFAQ
jgi:hypothetical protein